MNDSETTSIFGHIKKGFLTLTAGSALAVGLSSCGTVPNYTVEDLAPPAPIGSNPSPDFNNQRRSIHPIGYKHPLYDQGWFILVGESEEPLHDLFPDPDAIEYDTNKKHLKKLSKVANAMADEPLASEGVQETETFNKSELKNFIGALSAVADPQYRLSERPAIYQDALAGLLKFPKGSAERSILGAYLSVLIDHDKGAYQKASAINPAIDYKNEGVVHTWAKQNFANTLDYEGRLRIVSARGVTYYLEPSMYTQVVNDCQAQPALQGVTAATANSQMLRCAMSKIGQTRLSLTAEASEYLKEFASATMKGFSKTMGENRNLLPFMAMLSTTQDIESMPKKSQQMLIDQVYDNANYNNREAERFIIQDQRRGYDSYDQNGNNGKILNFINTSEEGQAKLAPLVTTSMVDPEDPTLRVMAPDEAERFHRGLEKSAKQIMVAMESAGQENPLEKFRRQQKQKGADNLGLA